MDSEMRALELTKQKNEEKHGKKQDKMLNRGYKKYKSDYTPGGARTGRGGKMRAAVLKAQSSKKNNTIETVVANAITDTAKAEPSGAKS